jgi:hypothetical protein
MGLHGHLSKLVTDDIYKYFAGHQEETVIGLLLGMSVSKIGTMDYVSRVLTLFGVIF